jgi:signal transduction histidine kinase
VRHHYRFLVRLDDATRRLAEPDHIMQAMARLLGRYLDVDRCVYADADIDRRTFEVLGDYTRGVPSMVGRYPLTTFGEPFARAMLAGEPFVVNDVAHDERTAGVPEIFERLSIASAITVPVLKEGDQGLDAGIGVLARRPRVWREDEVELVRAVSLRAWDSIQRARQKRALQQSEDRLRLALERERAARADAERANRLKDEFLATLSHELRTPLNAILGWLEMLREPALASEAQRRAVAVIERNARAQAKLVDDLLDMSRIMSGGLHLDSELVDLGQVVTQAVASVEPAADSRQVAVAARVDAASPMVKGDAARLQQVAVNLIGNAVKFSRPGGVVDIVLTRRGETLELTVHDDGSGIAPEFLPFLFEPFRQQDASTTRQHGGVGLGLSIVKHLVDRHGGTVSASSGGRGAGATFIVALPAAEVGAVRGTARLPSGA